MVHLLMILRSHVLCVHLLWLHVHWSWRAELAMVMLGLLRNLLLLLVLLTSHTLLLLSLASFSVDLLVSFL